MAERWESLSSKGSVPADAVFAGNDTNGAKLYCGRAEYSDEFLPAKVLPTMAYVSSDGVSIMKTEFEILCGNFRWEHASNGDIVDGAMAIGRTTEGEKLYLGRATYEGDPAPGRIHKSHGCMYIANGGKDMAFKEYEVLVRL